MTTRRKTMELVHYGDAAFDRKKFTPVKDGGFLPKPKGGLWASPVGSEFGWKEWCEGEQFALDTFGKSFRFTITGRVLVIDSARDLRKLVWDSLRDHLPMVVKDPPRALAGRRFEFQFPVFEPLLKRGVDAIHLTERGQWATRLTHPRNLYGWDCESVLVMNPDCVNG